MIQEIKISATFPLLRSNGERFGSSKKETSEPEG
jgi:hypothetical protein